MKKKIVLFIMIFFLCISCGNQGKLIKQVTKPQLTEQEEGFLGIKWKASQDVFSKYDCMIDMKVTYKIPGLESYNCAQVKYFGPFMGLETKYMYYNNQYFLGRLTFDKDVNIDDITKELFTRFGAPLKTTETTEVFSKRLVETRKEWKTATTEIFLDYGINGNPKLTMCYYPITWLVDKMIRNSKQSWNLDEDEE